MLVIVVAILLTAAMPAGSKLVYLDLINKTGATGSPLGGDVYVQLDQIGALKNVSASSGVKRFSFETPATPAHYYLTAYDGYVTSYTVTRGLYKSKVWMCGTSKSGELNMASNVRLNFTDCHAITNPAFSAYPLNAGEPTMEKMHFRLNYFDRQWPTGEEWRWQYP
jgi:hypothetical protein